MAGEAQFPSTGLEVIDELQGLQKIADLIDEPKAKIERVRDTLQLIDARTLFGHQLMVSAATVYARKPDAAPEDRIRYESGLFFVGKLDRLTYMLDPNIPVDSLTLCFEEPEVLDVEPEHAVAFRSLSLRVPVLAVDSCMDAEAA